MSSGKSAPFIRHIRSLIESGHSKSQCMQIVRYVGDDPLKFDALIQVFLDGPYRNTQRAAWPLSYCVEEHPSLVRPHTDRLVRFLGTAGTHNAVRRNILRLFQFITIPEKHHAVLIDLCGKFLIGNEPVAVQVFAMEVWAIIAIQYPELRLELRMILEEHLPYASPAYRSRAKKILNSFDKARLESA